MKHLACATACATLLAAAPLHATGLSDPVVEPEVVVADTIDNSRDSSELIIPLMVMLLIVGVGTGR